ncbi:hypothetical protein VTJ83DRAFT_5977 [Remersonia thermophila]|uniref:Ubiquitin-conjugating enzyme E2C-binding protein n=1 Tax=Remersonia thermophila TaxID=72144 RepID=A0ABR4D946_9PEZI
MSSSSSSSSACALYAELLVNIRQISIAASLDSPSDASTQVSLSADGRTVHLAHRGQTSRLILPGKAALGGTLLPVQDRQKGTASLSWRLAADGAALPPSQRQAAVEDVPWSATDLAPTSGVACRHCGADVVPGGSVKAWKDLPSENWAEMMEFWHCHKPDHHHHPHHDGNGNSKDSAKADEKSLASRGYGASSAIQAQKGVGFVDLTSLLFAETDCRNLTFSWSSHAQGASESQALVASASSGGPSRNPNVFCSSCHAQLGLFNVRASAVTLLKWQVLCRSASGSVPTAPECLAASLIASAARSGSSKSLVTPLPDAARGDPGKGAETDALHIWMLNSGIVFSSSGVPRCVPAIKLLFRAVSVEEADKMLAGLTCDSHEISLPGGTIRQILQHLQESTTLLPPGERTFQGWNVGLLSKWNVDGPSATN